MSLTGFLKFGETFLPITRGELVKDSNGDIAFYSPLFEAKAIGDPGFPEGRHGLITGAEKKILQALANEDSTILTQVPLSIQFGDTEAYIYDGKDEILIQFIEGDNITIADNGSGEITISANDPTVKMETITATSEEENYPILLANLPSDQESESEYRITTYKHLDLNYNPFTKTLIVPNIEGSSKFAKYIDTKTAIGSATNPIYVTNEGEIVASETTVGNSDTTTDDPLENYAIPVYLKEGVITAIDATIGGPIEIGTYGGFGLSYMSSGTILSYHGSLGNRGQYPLCVENGVLQHASKDIGLPYYGIYMLNGELKQMDYYLKANIHPGTGLSELVQTSSPLAVYSSASDIGKLATNVGDSNHPLWVENGSLSPIKIGASIETLYIVGTVNGENTNGSLYTGAQDNSGVRLIGGNKVYASGGFFESSDETLKDFHSDIPIDLDHLSKLPKKYFTWKTDETQAMHMGTSAQELQKLYPELVQEDEHGLLNVAYDKLSVVALAAIDQLHHQINELKSENQQMQARLEKLEKLIYVNECQS